MNIGQVLEVHLGYAAKTLGWKVATPIFDGATDIHTGRNAERIEHDIERCAIRQERHFLFRQDSRHNTLVSMTARHFIADGNLSFLGLSLIHI